MPGDSLGRLASADEADDRRVTEWLEIISAKLQPHLTALVVKSAQERAEGPGVIAAAAKGLRALIGMT